MARKRPAEGRLPFTAAIDERIVAGLLDDREAAFPELEQAGFNRDAILARARALGLTRDFLAQCHAHGAKVALRRCLVCDADMVSLGAHNRICERCRRRR